MKKIVILSAVNIKHMSLISLYTDFLEKNKINYDIIYMDKYNEKEKIGANKIYRYINPINKKKGFIYKILKYFKFKKYAKTILEKNKYDFIIVWNDVAIIMFGLYLAKYWPKKYCLNCRDYFGEKIFPIFYIFKKAIQYSVFTTISSKGFLSFLPKGNYVEIESLNKKILNECSPRDGKTNKIIKIGFIGNVRFFKENFKFIKCLKNDNRFELHYYGTNSEKIEEYVKSKNIKNVICNGAFPIEETKKYLEKCDMINSIYGTKTIGVRTLVSIRLFYAAYMKIPILVSKGTYMQKIVEKFKMGYVVDMEERKLADKLYLWYSTFSFKEFKIGCEKLLIETEKNNKRLEEILKREVL